EERVRDKAAAEAIGMLADLLGDVAMVREWVMAFRHRDEGLEDGAVDPTRLPIHEERAVHQPEQVLAGERWCPKSAEVGRGRDVDVGVDDHGALLFTA